MDIYLTDKTIAMRKKILFTALTAIALTCATSCGSKGGETAAADSTVTDTAAFDESQPVASGQYDATAYDITGTCGPRRQV